MLDIDCDDWKISQGRNLPTIFVGLFFFLKNKQVDFFEIKKSKKMIVPA